MNMSRVCLKLVGVLLISLSLTKRHWMLAGTQKCWMMECCGIRETPVEHIFIVLSDKEACILHRLLALKNSRKDGKSTIIHAQHTNVYTKYSQRHKSF